MSKGKRQKRDAISFELRERVLKRDGYACRYCYSMKGPFHLDHVYPFSRGGETSFNNLVTACPRCNIKKHNKVGIWPRPLVLIRRRYPSIRTRILPKRPYENIPEVSEWILEFPPLPVPTPRYKTRDFWEVYCGLAIKLFSSLGLGLMIGLVMVGFDSVDTMTKTVIFLMWGIPFVQLATGYCFDGVRKMYVTFSKVSAMLSVKASMASTYREPYK